MWNNSEATSWQHCHFPPYWASIALPIDTKRCSGHGVKVEQADELTMKPTYNDWWAGTKAKDNLKSKQMDLQN